MPEFAKRTTPNAAANYRRPLRQLFDEGLRSNHLKKKAPPQTAHAILQIGNLIQQLVFSFVIPD
jgi:hypothetical protein